MADLDVLLAFAAAALAFAYMPGPALLFTAAQTAARGRRAGWIAVAGIHTGCYVHVFAATFGLAALFHAVPIAYTVMKFAGAAYLLFLGLQLVFSRGAKGVDATAPPRATATLFRDSMIVEIFNPKAALFFLAFLPQFIDPGGSLPVWAQLLILGTIVNLTFSSADAACVLAADRVMRAAKGSQRVQSALRRLGGAALIGLGVHLAASKG